MEDKKLFEMASKTLENAYAPFSKFKVGAAILTRDGHVFTGVNIENSAYGDTICAERSALAAAVTAGYREFDAIAIAGEDIEAWPCGTCRQVLFEFSPKMKVITGRNKENLVIMTLEELLPYGFKLDK